MAEFTNATRPRQRTHRSPLHVYLYLTLHMGPYADIRASWTGHAALNELGVAYFALYLMHDRNGPRLQGVWVQGARSRLLSRLVLVS